MSLEIAAGFELVTVQSGARSLRSQEHGETFHPVVGPMIEAVTLHVRQQRLIERAKRVCDEESGRPFVIWDVGLGAAANAIAAREAFEGSPANVELHSFDCSTTPLAFALEHAAELGYVLPHVAAIRELLDAGQCMKGARGGGSMLWRAHWGDFRERMGGAPAPDAILYDPYSPRANPELWTLEHLTRMRECLDPGRSCLLSNYTRSTAVRVTLMLAGFFVGCGHATGEKDQTTIASNCFDLLEDPLGVDWLSRVGRSTRSGPLREGGGEPVIRSEEWARLGAHLQFSH